ncbi:uncharacterized protein F4822DRAFT_391558 [Hypoxylon trugodes]|uniref:uncharacterized protein n=1 Tax=Hypoxylon trugodes TaxID=326681 RepID=UPI00219B6BC6|nr:uncharacterized protein F4822DRAFT_391558 [Hypoxylon trugodes]KAI1392620.1 hypothetical protein F4822DRAFT_391558 [Hypoxylon trugodes]
MTSQLSPSLVTLLRLVPAFSSTCSLWFAHDQWFFLKIFTKPEQRAHASQILPPYFTEFAKYGVIRVAGLLLASIVSSGAILQHSGEELQRYGSRSWYLAGAGFATSHLVFAPFILPHIQNIINDSGKENSIQSLHAWLRIHVIRSLTSDIAAWVCFVVAAVTTFTTEL